MLYTASLIHNSSIDDGYLSPNCASKLGAVAAATFLCLNGAIMLHLLGILLDAKFGILI